MAGKPAATVGKSVSHPLPPVLTGSGCFMVLIGNMPAWRGMPAAGAAALNTAKKVSDGVLKGLKAATTAAKGTPGFAAAEIAEKAGQAAAAVAMGSMISGMAATPMGIADIHMCATLLPVPPHGPGLVVDGSATVLIQGMPAARLGSTIVEALGPPNKITSGAMNVMIGG